MPPASHDDGPAGQAGELSVAARAALLILRGYKVALSPLFYGWCRYSPSCSEYMADALREHGVVFGGFLGLRRLLRCHPFGGHGYDPVPTRRP
jgi:uncharacterized protein